MERIFFFLLLSLFYSNAFSQKEIFIDLKPDSAFRNIHFSYSKVIDARDNKTHIGLVTRGLGFVNNNTKVNFNKDFAEHIDETLVKLISKSKDTLGIIIIIRNLIISENIGTMSHYGYCNTEIEFAKYKDNRLYSLGTYLSSIIEKKSDIEGTHSQRIIKSFEECFMKFQNSNWENITGKLIQTFYQDSIFDYKNVPPKGIYMTFNQMIRKTPFKINYEIEISKTVKDNNVYQIVFKNNMNPDLVQFVSDGASLYLNIGNDNYLKAENFGKYIYFEGRVPIVIEHTNTYQPVYLVSFGGVGALIGSIVLSATANSIMASSYNSTTYTTNTSYKGAIFDTEKGNIRNVTERCLHDITKPYPELLKNYRKTNRKLEDKKQVVFELNTKY